MESTEQSPRFNLTVSHFIRKVREIREPVTASKGGVP